MVYDTFYSVSPTAYAVFLKILVGKRERIVYPGAIVGVLLTHGLIFRADSGGYYVPKAIKEEHDGWLEKRAGQEVRRMRV